MEGLSQLLILLIFAAIAFLEGVGRRRKAAPPRPRPPAQPLPRPSSRTRREVGSATPPRPPSPPGEAEEAEPRTSEGVLPEELWEELLGLPPRRKTSASGAKRPEGEDLAAEGVEGKEEIPPFEARSLEEESLRRPPGARKVGGKAVEESDLGGDRSPGRGSQDPPAETPPVSLEETPRRMSGFAPVPSAGPGSATLSPPFPPAGPGLDRDGPKLVLSAVGAGVDFRKAVVLREILGPPLAVRGWGDGDGLPVGW